ncbi:MAG: lipid-A-disaccharide synthase [bacterium]
MIMQKILIITGEVSGDIHASSLINQIKQQTSDFEFWGIGGKKMEEAGVNILLPMESLTAIGFISPLINILNYRRIFKFLHQWMIDYKPKAVILVDFPGFNLQIACRAHHLKIPVIYYIMPQVWAWGGWRVKQIKKFVDLGLSVLPFACDYLNEQGVKSEYVGHPVIDSIVNDCSVQNSYPFPDLKSKSTKIIGLFPGSRKSEIQRHFQIMMDVARSMEKTKPYQFLAAIEQEVVGNLDLPGNVTLIPQGSYQIMRSAELLVAASGTVTLEGAWFKKPMIVIYRTEWITFVIAKLLAKVESISLVNLIAGKKIIPELIQNNVNVRNISSYIQKILEDDSYYGEIVEQLKKVKCKIGPPGASRRAAELIIKFISRF